MSLPAILEVIQASGQAQVGAIEACTQAQVAEILEKAEAEAARLRKETRAMVSASAAEERARILHQARFKTLQIVGDAREELVDAGFYQIRECLAGIRRTAVYPAVLRQLTEEALAELQNSLEDVKRARLEADPRDRALLERILSDMALQLPIENDLICWGGLIARSEDGRVIVVNTLESRLERTTSYLRHYLVAQTAEAVKDEICLVTTMAMHACGR